MAETAQYDAFAAEYDWVFSDPMSVGERRLKPLEPALDSLPADGMILDCACGTGLLALALACGGYRAKGSDASAGMIAQAKRHAAETGANVTFSVCSWEHLPQVHPERFDLAICCGNTIGHCRDEDEMLRSFRSIRAALKEGARLVLDTRNWEKVLAERVRFTWLGVRQRDGKRCVPVYVWTFPRGPGEPVVIEVVLVFEQDEKVWLKTYPIAYYPFRVEELTRRLADAGFCDIQADCAKDRDAYNVAARAM